MKNICNETTGGETIRRRQNALNERGYDGSDCGLPGQATFDAPGGAAHAGDAEAIAAIREACIWNDRMIKKTFIQTGKDLIARVTFSFPGEIWADTIYLVGDFNEWNQSSHPFQLNRAGVWILTVELEADRFYQFRYLCDGVWTNDNQADAYAHNRYGSDNFVVVTDPLWKKNADESDS